jgi:hypothetical protein
MNTDKLLRIAKFCECGLTLSNCHLSDELFGHLLHLSHLNFTTHFDITNFKVCEYYESDAD